MSCLLFAAGVLQTSTCGQDSLMSPESMLLVLTLHAWLHDLVDKLSCRLEWRACEAWSIWTASRASSAVWKAKSMSDLVEKLTASTYRPPGGFRWFRNLQEFASHL
jgi:hypothetical protein